MSRLVITEPGIYDIPAELYHQDPCPAPSASSSILKVLLNENPAKAREGHPRLNPDFVSGDGEEKFDRGHACHILMLNDEHKFKIIKADSYRSGDAKKARAEAYIEGLVPILEHKWPEVVAMCESGRAQLAAHQDASDIFSNGKPEQTLIWFEEIRGVKIWCRARIDYVPNKRGRPYGDYKSLAASVNPDFLQRYSASAGWAFQEAFYRRGIRAVLGEEDPSFKFVAHETDSPYCLAVVDNAPERVGVNARKVEYALDLWAWCIKNNSWPGYPNRTCTLEATPWEEGAFIARETREQDDRAGGVDLYKQMLKWQAPHEL